MSKIVALSLALAGFAALAAGAQEAPHGFPVKVYISSQVRATPAPTAPNRPLSPDLQAALRQAVGDWNRIAGGLLAQPSEQGFTLVLGSAPARAQKVQVAPILTLVEDRRMADLVIEPVAQLDSPGRTGLWQESSGNYLGTRFVSTLAKEKELTALALRRRALQQIGLALGLAPKPESQTCNLMSGALVGCKLPPAECAAAEPPCLAVRPSQLQQVQRLVRQLPPFERAKGKVLPSFPEEAILNGWSGRTVVRAYIHRSGRVEQAFIGESSGNWTLDQAALAAVNSTTFEPALSGGKPVSDWLTVPIVFQKSL